MAEPNACDVSDDERGDAQPKHELQRLDCLPAKLPPLIKRPYAETGMNQRRLSNTIAIGRNRQNAVVIDTRGKGIHRDVAERMVEKMADQIGKHNQPAGKADLPDADAADFRDPL